MDTWWLLHHSQFGDMLAQRIWAVAGGGGEGEACWRNSGWQEVLRPFIVFFSIHLPTCCLCLPGKSQAPRVSDGCIHFLKSSFKNES